jgi:predicted RNA-binding Zn-ribbon protein involved in translation (DUF1610 family)
MPRKYYVKYTRELLTEAAANSISIAGVLRYLQIPVTGLQIPVTGGAHAHVSRRLKQLGIDTSHFLGQAHMRSQPAAWRLTPERVLVVPSSGSGRPKPHVLRRALRESGVLYACHVCGIKAVWNGRPIVLHVDHISGDWLDDRKENLRFRCPNCHSQTPTFAGKAKNKKGP